MEPIASLPTSYPDGDRGANSGARPGGLDHAGDLINGVAGSDQAAHYLVDHPVPGSQPALQILGSRAGYAGVQSRQAHALEMGGLVRHRLIGFRLDSQALRRLGTESHSNVSHDSGRGPPALFRPFADPVDRAAGVIRREPVQQDAVGFGPAQAAHPGPERGHDQGAVKLFAQNPQPCLDTPNAAGAAADAEIETLQAEEVLAGAGSDRLRWKVGQGNYTDSKPGPGPGRQAAKNREGVGAGRVVQPEGVKSLLFCLAAGRLDRLAGRGDCQPDATYCHTLG